MYLEFDTPEDYINSVDVYIERSDNYSVVIDSYDWVELLKITDNSVVIQNKYYEYTTPLLDFDAGYVHNVIKVVQYKRKEIETEFGIDYEDYDFQTIYELN